MRLLQTAVGWLRSDRAAIAAPSLERYLLTRSASQYRRFRRLTSPKGNACVWNRSICRASTVSPRRSRLRRARWLFPDRDPPRLRWVLPLCSDRDTRYVSSTSWPQRRNRRIVWSHLPTTRTSRQRVPSRQSAGERALRPELLIHRWVSRAWHPRRDLGPPRRRTQPTLVSARSRSRQCRDQCGQHEALSDRSMLQFTNQYGGTVGRCAASAIARRRDQPCL